MDALDVVVLAGFAGAADAFFAGVVVLVLPDVLELAAVASAAFAVPATMIAFTSAMIDTEPYRLAFGKNALILKSAVGGELLSLGKSGGGIWSMVGSFMLFLKIAGLTFLI